MNFKQFSLLISLNILLNANVLQAQKGDSAKIDLLMKQVYKNGIFNGNVLVIQNGKQIYQSSFGFANGSRTTKLNAGYMFNIGSIGKEFNAVGIMMLKEQGKLNPDDKISKYLDGLPQWAERVSIKNLLQYTSGLPDINWKIIKSDADIWSDMKNIGVLNFEPGTNYAYNNSNVFLQRRIIEKISGLRFQDFVQKNMLQPCGMSESVVDPDMNGARVAVSFNNDFVQSPRQFDYVMTGWTSVTATDLYKWAKCLHTYKLINKDSFKEILLPVSPNKQAGLGGGRLEGSTVAEHTHHGSSADFEALMYTEPVADNAIILLTNNKNFKVFEIKDAINSILKGTPYSIPKRSLLTAFKPKLNDLNGEELISFYKQLKVKQPDDFNFGNESELNMIGYELLGSNRFKEAIKIFELNVELFPVSANAYDSLAEAFYKNGEKKSALFFYKKSLELDANNPGAKEIVTKLEGGK
jgi:CubicO group peptidase (beta-lactamase class C family)